jgi:hypothetical protein
VASVGERTQNSTELPFVVAFVNQWLMNFDRLKPAPLLTSIAACPRNLANAVPYVNMPVGHHQPKRVDDPCVREHRIFWSPRGCRVVDTVDRNNLWRAATKRFLKDRSSKPVP